MRPLLLRTGVLVLLLTGLLALRGALGSGEAPPDPAAAPGPSAPDTAREPVPEGGRAAALRGAGGEPEARDAARGSDPEGGAPEAPEPAPADPGAATGVLEGRLLWEPGAGSRSHWDARLEGPGRQWPMNDVRVDAEGRFRFEGLRPGTFELWVERDGDTLARVGELRVEPDRVTRDPRLFPLDLRDAVGEMRLRFAPGGPALHDARAFLDLGPHQRNWGGRTGEALVLVAPRDTEAEVWVVARGYRPQHLPFSPGEHVLTLERGLGVALRARRPSRRAEGVVAVRFAVQPEEVPEGVWPSDLQVEFDGSALIAGRAQSVPLPGPGRYRLWYAATTQRGPGFLPIYRREASEVFEVHEHEQGATLELDLVEVVEAD